MDAIAYNRQLDEKLSASGVIDAELFCKLAEAHAYDAASTVGWVEAKLRVLQERLSRGGALHLYEPSQRSAIVVSTQAELQQWAVRHFPAVGLQP